MPIPEGESHGGVGVSPTRRLKRFLERQIQVGADSGIHYAKLKYTMRRWLLASTRVRVSRNTLTELEKLRDQLNARSLGEAIDTLIRRHRIAALRAALGADRGKVKPFAETDRGKDR